jgi:hypothetical protein
MTIRQELGVIVLGFFSFATMLLCWGCMLVFLFESNWVPMAVSGLVATISGLTLNMCIDKLFG